MNVHDHKQLSETLSHTADLSLQALVETLETLDRGTLAEGIVRSDARIMKAAFIIDDAVKRFVSFSLEHARRTGAGFEAFELARLYSEQLCVSFQAELPYILLPRGGNAGTGAGSGFAWKASADLFERLHNDLAAAFQIAAHDFRQTSANDSVAVDERIMMPKPGGHLTMPVDFVNLADARLNLIGMLLRARGRNSYGVWADDTRQRQQTARDRASALREAQNDVWDALVKSATHRMACPPLDLWTRAGMHVAPEQIDHRRLALSHSLNWQKALMIGHLAVTGADALASLNGQPLFIRNADFHDYAKAVLPILHPSPHRKPVSESSLNSWWIKMVERDSLSQAELLKAVRAEFPNNSISRDRIRDLTNGRKRGRKPKRGKTPA